MTELDIFAQPIDLDGKLPGTALAQMQALMKEAERRNLPEPTCATLATASRDACPSLRTVYIAAIIERGVVFFANMHSGKGKQIVENPRAALCQFWPAMQQQVIVEGDTEVLADEFSDRLWQKRARDSQLASWASEQGQPPTTDASLQQQGRQARQAFSGQQVPRPAHWKAVLVHPDRIEFWATGWHRLLPRHRCHKQPDGEWVESIENP